MAFPEQTFWVLFAEFSVSVFPVMLTTILSVRVAPQEFVAVKIKFIELPAVAEAGIL